MRRVTSGDYFHKKDEAIIISTAAAVLPIPASWLMVRLSIIIIKMVFMIFFFEGKGNTMMVYHRRRCLAAVVSKHPLWQIY